MLCVAVGCSFVKCCLLSTNVMYRLLLAVVLCVVRRLLFVGFVCCVLSIDCYVLSDVCCVVFGVCCALRVVCCLLCAVCCCCVL